MTSTCLVCYEDSQVFILPPCNHTGICWKCCLKLVQGSIFSCPFCKDKPQIKSQLLFVTTNQMNTKDFDSIIKSNPFRSNKNTFYYYSNSQVADYIESNTSFHCALCGQIHQTINILKKHIYSCHKRQFCEVCLDNRRCIISQQILYSDQELQFHLKQGDISQTGEVILYHPNCQFCSRRFYDLDAFRMHLKVSAHMKCDICDRNAQKLKYIYYKNYEDLQRHHKKTHFVCDVGDCVAKKLENVFASEEILEQHKKRCHRKYKGDRNEKVENIIMGFNKTSEEEVIAYDGIGKSIQKQIAVFQREEKVDKQQHNDQFIDIRQFYPEVVKAAHHIKTDDIVERIKQLHDQYGPKMRQVNFNDVFLFKPLEMPSLTRVQLQRFLKRAFPPKDAEGISDIFFTKRNQFTSFNDFFQTIEKKMRAYSNIAFFLAFPQLIRFMKDENRNKVPMDIYYGIKLRALNVNKPFIFHTFDRYSNVFQFLKSQIEIQMISRCDKGHVQIDKYCRFLKEMNGNYYLQNQDDIYYVSKQKITNLYHMIERCKTKDLFKMNWLLKIGFTQQSYQFIIKHFYYRTREQCDSRIFQNFTVKELSLIYVYATICLQALLDSQTFQANKKYPKAHYFTQFLTNVKRPTTISNRIFQEIRQLQNNALGIQKKIKESSKKGVVIDQSDCPSLLVLKTDLPPERRKPPQIPEVGIGKSRLPIWNEDQAIRKKPQVKLKSIKNEDDFPTLSGTANNNQKQQILRQKIKKQQQQQFPVYNFNEKYVNSKLIIAKDQKKPISDFISFNNKTKTNYKWDQDRTRQRFYQIEQQKKQREKAEQAFIKKKNNMLKDTKAEIKEIKPQKFFNQDRSEYRRQTPRHHFFDDQQDLQLKWAINQSLKFVPKQQVLIPRKQKKIDQSENNRKNKSRKPQKQQQNIKPNKLSDLLFQKIQQEAQIAKKPIKKQKFKVDSSDSEQQTTKPKHTINHKKQQSFMAKFYTEPKVVLDYEQFASISQLNSKSKGSQSKLNKITKQSNKPKEPLIQTNDFQSVNKDQAAQKQSIVNRIIKQSSHAETQNTKKVKSGKNGKKVIIQSVRLF